MKVCRCKEGTMKRLNSDHVWGDRAETRGLVAHAYLLRRFGPLGEAEIPTRIYVTARNGRVRRARWIHITWSVRS